MLHLWPKRYPNIVLLNLNQCAQGCSLSNLTLQGVFGSPLFWIWPFFGQEMVLTRSFKFFLPESQCAQGCSMQNFIMLVVSCSPVS